MYVHWLYTGLINGDTIPMSQAYVLGEFIQDLQFQDVVMKKLIPMIQKEKHPPESCVEIIYSGTSEGSPARRLCLHIWGYMIYQTQDLVEHMADNMPVEFVRDLLKVVILKKNHPKKAQPWVLTSESYLLLKPGETEEGPSTSISK